jgi:hypothetical protein
MDIKVYRTAMMVDLSFPFTTSNSGEKNQNPPKTDLSANTFSPGDYVLRVEAFGSRALQESRVVSHSTVCISDDDAINDDAMTMMR